MHEGLRRLGEEYWEWQLETNPTQALLLGDHRYDDRMEEATREAEDEEIAGYRRFATRAEAIDPTELDDQERTSREVLIFEATHSAEYLATRMSEMAVNPRIGLHEMIWNVVPQFPITEPQHAEELLVKYRGIGRAMRQMGERFREGVESGRVPIERHAAAVVEQIDRYLGSPIDQDKFLQVRTPASYDEATTAVYRDRLKQVVEEHIRPAYRAMRDVIADDVIPAGRSDEECGIAHVPGGDAIYRIAIRHSTSLGDLSAERIHQIGLDEIARLDDEYRALGKEVLGTTDLEEIYRRMREDPELHFEDGEDVVEASRAALAKAKEAMDDWFGRLPKADCVVNATEAGPVAFYFPPAKDGSRPGTFFVNVADPKNWGRFSIEAMAYHEGIPGHHLQLAIAQELEDIPDFRKHASVMAYSEGWGLYTERLADEMGLYSGPLERMGMLSADSMRACRLVVDTGMHALGWTRQQAIDYMAANSPMSVGMITDEIDRYIGMPGQALAYMIGRREIQRMRRSAEQSMGDRFEIRGFHDVVLGSGALPLPVLDRLVSEWVAA